MQGLPTGARGQWAGESLNANKALCKKSRDHRCHPVSCSVGCAFYPAAEEAAQPIGRKTTWMPQRSLCRCVTAEGTRGAIEEVIAINQDNGNLVVEEEMKTNVQLRLYWRKTTNKETREETSNKILISTMSLVNARPRDVSILALSERY